jgi:hypothetical protein
MCADDAEEAVMQRFIPFDDQWDELARLDPGSLVPYHVDVPCERGLADDQRAGAGAPSIASSSPTFSPIRPAVPAATSRT